MYIVPPLMFVSYLTIFLVLLDYRKKDIWKALVYIGVFHSVGGAVWLFSTQKWPIIVGCLPLLAALPFIVAAIGKRVAKRKENK